MKNFLKKNYKFIIGIVLGVLATATLTYAATISAGNVSFDNTQSGIEADNVNEAINKLYEKAQNSGPQCAVKLGDYVSLTPTKTSFKIKMSLTGYTIDQTINPSDLTLWRVIDIHSDGSFDVVSEYVTSTKVAFRGTTGYANFVGVLNTIAAQYQVPGKTIGSRYMGYGGQTSIIGDTSAFDGTTAPPTTTISPPTTGTGREYALTSPGDIGDTLYLKDYLLVKNVYGNVNAVARTGSSTGYWLASRSFKVNSTFYNFGGRYVDTSGTIWNSDSCRSYNSNNSTWSDSSGNYGRSVRPILTLKSGITTNGGDGSKDNPYTLS